MKVTYIDLGLHRYATEVSMFIQVCERLGLDYHVYGIEADPLYAPALVALFADNPKVETFSFAVAAEDGTCRLYRSAFLNGEGSSIYATKNNVDPSDSVEVLSRKLSGFMKGIDLHDAVVLKWNIEGAEYPMMNDLIESGLYRNIDLWCGAGSDMYKVAELAELEYSYHLAMLQHGIGQFKFHDHHDPWLKKRMIDEMEFRLTALRDAYYLRHA